MTVVHHNLQPFRQHNPNSPAAETENLGPNLTSPVARRSFLRYSGAGLVVGGPWLAGCSKGSDPVVDPNAGLTNVGTGDFSIMNYAYALKYLEAALRPGGDVVLQRRYRRRKSYSDRPARP